MRRLPGLLAAGLMAALLAGCSGSSEATDPYDAAVRATHADWQRVMVEVGVSATVGADTFTLDKSAIRLISDTTTGAFSFRLALPAAELGIDAAALQQLGISGDSLDVDLVYDGTALYARSPALGFFLSLLYAQAGEAPPGDLSGWLRLGTAAELESLMGDAGVPELSPPPAPSDLDAEGLKASLEENGIVLSFVGVEQRNGVDANHLEATIDLQGLMDNEAFDELSRTQLEQLQAFAQDGTLTADLWIDRSNDRLVEVDVHAAMTGAEAGSVDVVVAFGEPPAGSTFEAPESYVEIPAQELFTMIMGMVGAEMFGG